jgi:hypothetical protein
VRLQRQIGYGAESIRINGATPRKVIGLAQREASNYGFPFSIRKAESRRNDVRKNLLI